MESGTKNKVGFFAIGLIAGVSLGVVFGYAIKEGLARLNFLHSSLNEIDTRQSQISVRLDSIESKISKNDAEPKHSYTQYMPKAAAIIGQKKEKDADTALRAADGNDSVSVSSADSNVVVMTDEMVSFRIIPLTSLDSSLRSRAAAKSDSLIGVLNENTTQSDISAYRTEFWESPINLKGYRMSAGKLILFGIDSATPVKLVQCGGVVYIIAGQNVFRTEFTDDFRPYEKVTDKNLVKKLKG